MHWEGKYIHFFITISFSLSSMDDFLFVAFLTLPNLFDSFKDEMCQLYPDSKMLILEKS